jgi:hypothetical protein
MKGQEKVERHLDRNKCNGNTTYRLCFPYSKNIGLERNTVDYTLHSFRHGLDHVSDADFAWAEILKVVKSITRSDILQQQILNLEKWQAGKKSGSGYYKPPVGAQDVLNKIINSKFRDIGGWDSQVYVLKQGKAKVSKGDKVPYWSMDFRKDKIGLEISFNNAGVLAQNLLRLSVMSESKYLEDWQMIKLGVLLVSEANLKSWGSMDTTVLTYDQVLNVLPHVNFSIPTPIIIIGVNNSTDGEVWEKTELFGTKKKDLPIYSKLSHLERTIWDGMISKEKELL